MNQIKDQREQFFNLRKDIIGASCKDAKERNLRIRSFVLDNLENDGFDLQDPGTQYLATLITLFYHERKLYRRKDLRADNYWDLTDRLNLHYGMLGNTSDNAIDAMEKAIQKNKGEDGPLEEIVYDIADYTCYLKNRDERRRKYTELSRQTKELIHINAFIFIKYALYYKYIVKENYMKYRLPTIEDKEIIIDYIKDHYENNEKSISASNMLTSLKYEDWVEKINNNSIIPDEIWGKSLTYLVFNDDERLVGLLNIRYDLNKEMANKYGHIGYGVRPSERRKGYATQMLQYALEECKKLKMQKVILGCYKGNSGSAKTIIKNGGKLTNETEETVEISSNWKINIIRQYYEIIL